MLDLETRLRQSIRQEFINKYRHQPGRILARNSFSRAVLLEVLLSWLSIALISLTGVSLIVLVMIGDTAQVPTRVAILTVLAGGGAAEIIWLLIGLGSEQYRDQALQEVPFRLAAIHDRRLRLKLYKALRYWAQIDDLICSTGRPSYDQGLTPHTNLISWMLSIYDLTRRIDQARIELVSKSDLKTITLAVQTHEQRLAEVQKEPQRQKIAQRLAAYQRQLQSLHRARHQLKKAEAQLDQVLVALEVVYTQLLVLTNSRVQRRQDPQLIAEIEDEIHRLQDLTEAVEELYSLIQRATLPDL